MAVNADASVAYLSIAQQALQLQSASDVLHVLHKRDVPVLALKGLALLKRVYPDLRDRSMGDIDLLIRRSDLASAEAVLQSSGYLFSDEGWGFSRAFANEFTGEVPYRKDSVVIELHWHLLPLAWYRRLTLVDIDSVWARAIPIKVTGADALRLCPEDEIIHLCCHTAIQHSLIHPHGYRDIIGVIRVERDNLDWLALAARAREWRVSVAVWAALSVTRQLKPAAIPAEMLAALRVPKWRQALLRPLLRRARAGKPVLISGSMRFFGVLLIDRLRDLPAVVLRGLFPGKRWLQLRYDLTPRQAVLRQFTYPVEVVRRGIKALAGSLAQAS